MNNFSFRPVAPIVAVFFIGFAAFSLFVHSKLSHLEKESDFEKENVKMVQNENLVLKSIDSSNVLVVTRVHASSAVSMSPIETIIDFVKSVSYASKVLICVGIDNHSHETYVQKLVESLETHNLTTKTSILSISPWGGFTHALNLAVSFAAEKKFSLVCFQSLETRSTKEIVRGLTDVFKIDMNALVVGPVFQGHEFQLGIWPIRGRTVPWNTLAIWDVQKLVLTGFPLISNGLGDVLAGGVEVI